MKQQEEGNMKLATSQKKKGNGTDVKWSGSTEYMQKETQLPPRNSIASQSIICGVGLHPYTH
jgi:hypothetical protein